MSEEEERALREEMQSLRQLVRRMEMEIETCDQKHRALTMRAIQLQTFLQDAVDFALADCIPKSESEKWKALIAKCHD